MRQLGAPPPLFEFGITISDTNWSRPSPVVLVARGDGDATRAQPAADQDGVAAAAGGDLAHGGEGAPPRPLLPCDAGRHLPQCVVPTDLQLHDETIECILA